MHNKLTLYLLLLLSTLVTLVSANDDTTKQNEWNRTVVLFALAVLSTVFVHLWKAILRFAGWALLLAITCAIVEATFTTIKTQAWPSIQQNHLPKLQSKLPNFPTINRPAFFDNIPGLKKKKTGGGID